ASSRDSSGASTRAAPGCTDPDPGTHRRRARRRGRGGRPTSSPRSHRATTPPRTPPATRLARTALRFGPRSSLQYGPGMSGERQAPDRNLALELARVTEAAALASGRWVGRGDKEGADGAAVDAMRLVLQSVTMDGVVVIGEGEKDEAPMLFNGEEIGTGDPPMTDIAVDPIDGTTLTSLGRGNALSVIAVSERGTMF